MERKTEDELAGLGLGLRLGLGVAAESRSNHFTSAQFVYYLLHSVALR